MARGQLLSQLVSDLRSELGRASSVAVGVDDVPILKQKLRGVQEQLYDEFDWPFLRQVFPAINLQAGQRYYDVPDEMNLERIEEIACWYSGVPHPMHRGIGFEEYSAYDSDADERADPTLKWDIRWTGTEPQIEVWPIPSSDDMTMQIIGLRTLKPLIENNQMSDLDGLMLVLYAAADLTEDDGTSKKLQARADRRYQRMKGRNDGGDGQFIYGGGKSQQARPSQAIVRVR